MTTAIIVFGLFLGLAGGLALHALTRPRRWHPRLRRLRRYLLGRAWRPVLLMPHVPAEPAPASPPVPSADTAGARTSSS